MKALLKKIFQNKKISSDKDLKFQDLKNNKGVYKIFGAINNYNETSEIRYVGGCVRKILNDEKTDDIDLATNLTPDQVKQCLDKNQIKFFETGIEHGTITAVIDDQNFEITTLRKDVKTDGRHAVVEYTTNWKEDSLRRDFSINSIYSDLDGNLYDPNSGHKDLNVGIIKFIGDPETRIKEDYLRILRYVRFFINYSNQKHNPEIIKIIKRNIEGISQLSPERLLDEFKKLLKSKGFVKLFKDKESLELIKIIFPQFKNIEDFKKMNTYASENLAKVDFIFLLSLMIIDETDNTEYFLYKFNISKKDQKRLKLIDTFYKEKTSVKNFNEKNFNKIFYFNGRQAVIDIINFKLFKSNKVDKKLIKLIKVYEDKTVPTMPIGANILMSKYNIPEGRTLGNKLKMIEELWVENGFQISDRQIQKIIKV